MDARAENRIVNGGNSVHRPGRSSPPAKPWERAGPAAGSSGPSPFAPPSNTNNTATAVATSSSRSVDQKDENGRSASITDGNGAGKPMPPRPWEQGHSGAMTNYGDNGMYGRGLGSGYGSGMYGGGLGSTSYRSSYGSPYNRMGMYGGGYGGSTYGGDYGGMGDGMYGNRYGGGYGGMSGMGGGYAMGPGNPNFPGGEPPPEAPNFWRSLLEGLTRVLHIFGRISMLVDENTQALHFFITALLQLCDRAGLLYGELARFVIRLVGFRGGAKARARAKASARVLEGAEMQPSQGAIIKPTSTKQSWDNVWTDGKGPP